ncbi:little elongation complex subunit 1 isoform X3 [Rana temporaria]|uniref:little elongation complex subunit 1 isoform X3 n=1 Tax=Rana temporaria TaxID=8407 RepID=UPI001AAD32A4|nr:little elongation complex subunit 1 isoform X3 [Rana temporaria]
MRAEPIISQVAVLEGSWKYCYRFKSDFPSQTGHFISSCTMMPGENPSKVAGIASEAAGSCQNCTSLQQNLNEYVAALITLKQKIIDSDHLLAEYQHKCDDLRDAERENKTLRYQLEQMLQKISPWEQTEEQLKSFRIELEKKTSVLDVVHQSQLEIVGVKKECKKCNMVKKKHQAKIKKTEAVASKHIKRVKQLQQEKRIIERELKKIQVKWKKLGDVQNKSMKNAQTQVAKDQPVVKLDKKKIRILLEELWDCIESSTENSDGDKPKLETNLGKGKHLQIPDDHTPSLKHFNPSTLSCKFDTFSEVVVVNASNDSTDCKKSHEIHTCKDAYNEYQQFQTETTVKDVFVLQDLNDSHLGNSDNECDIEELSQIMCWAKPLPHLLSPLQFSPFTTKYVFGEFTDSSDNEGSDERNKAKGSTSLERKQNCVQDQTNFVPCPEEGNVTEDCKQNVEFGRNVKYDRISIVEDCLTSQSEFCSNYKGELTTEMETDKKDIEITPMHIEVSFGVASNTLTTNVLTEQNPSEKEHSAVNRENSFEKSLEWYNNQNDPVRNVDRIDHSEVELLKHSSSGTIGDMTSMLEHPVGGDIAGRVVIENLHCSKEDRSSSARCNMVVHHNQSLNANGVLFSKDSPVHNCNLDEHKSIKSLQVYNIIGAEENHVPNIITSAEENHVHNNLSVHKLMDNSSYAIIDRSQDNLLLSAQPEMYLNEFHHHFNNDSRDLKDSEQSSCLEDVHNRKPNNGTSMDGEICFAAQTVQPLDKLKEKSGHSSSTPVVQFEYIKLINQYYTDKIDKIDPKHIQELPVHKANISLKQKLALRRLADGGHCYKASFNELGYDMQDSSEIMPASTPFNLDSSTTDKENHLSETFADKDSTCLSMEKLEHESKGNILASLQTCAIKAKESTHKSDSTSTSRIVTEQCKIGSEKVQLCSSDSNLYTLVSSKEQKAAVVDIQPVIATQLDICSQSQAVADQLCSAKHNRSCSTFLLHNTLSSNFDTTTTADGYLNRLEGKPFLTSKDMPQLSDQQFIKVSVDLVTDSRDQLDTVNKDLCKGINPKKDICAELDSTLEKTNTVYSLQSNSETLPKTFNQSTVMPIFPLEEEQRFNLCSDSTKVVNKIAKETDANQDACSASLDSSEEENFVIRKVSYAKAVSNNPVNLKKYSKGALESLEEKVCNVHLESNNSPCKPIITQRVDIECAGDLAAFVTSENDSFSSKTQNGILMEHESLVTCDLIVDQENYKSNSKNNGDQYSCEKENETTILEECEKQKEKLVSENIQYDNNTDQKLLDTIENEGKQTFPVKNFIWNFERPEESVDPGAISGKHKTRGNLKMLHGGSNNSFHRTAFNIEERTNRNRSHKVKYSNIVCQAVTKENHQRKLSRGEQSLQDTHVGETVLANADTSTNSDHSPETITKVRSEMGPPLPPLLGPLLATPPKSIHPLSPFLSSSSCSSLPSPLDDLISPLPGTPFPRHVSSLTSGRKQKSPVLATPSPAEKANKRILSSPLQFCAATPKHALPVPGRFPLSASGSSSNNVQENSVKILDTMYPELSARARTLNILKGNVQLSRSLPRDGKNLSVSQITGFKSITSTSTVFIKPGGNSNVDSSKDKLSSSENQQKSTSIGSSSEQTTDAFLMPRSAKRLRLDTESPVIETIKNCSTTPTNNDPEGQKCQESCHNIGYCELLPDVVKDSSIDEDIITKALKKIEDLCFDLLPVIRSHVHVGTIPKVPVMRNEEKEAIYEFSTSKKSLADRFLQVVLNKIRTGKRSIAPTYLQALCRVYVGLCRQLGNIERARILCYSILKEDFPDPDRLLLFIVSSWNDIFSTYGVVSKAIQAVLNNLAEDDVGSCLSAYLNWGKVQPMSVTVLLSSILMAVQLYPDGKFQQSKQYGEDLTDSIWEYVFAVDLLCSHRKWVWTHDKIISKELWPLLDKWVKRKKGNPNVSFVSDILVATVLRLVGMPWGVQLACVYMLFDLAPSDPAAIYKTLQAWKECAKSDIPPAVASCMQELESMCGLIK